VDSSSGSAAPWGVGTSPSRRDPHATQTGYVLHWRQTENAIGIGSTHHAALRNATMIRVSHATVWESDPPETGASGIASAGAVWTDESVKLCAVRLSGLRADAVAADQRPAATPIVSATSQMTSSVFRLDGCCSLGCPSRPHDWQCFETTATPSVRDSTGKVGRFRWGRQRVGPARPYGSVRTPNTQTVRDRYSSPGRSTVPGKAGWLGESGKCCVSRQNPVR
jgi:hypothetical protein